MAKVFVSYSRKDTEFAKRLTGELEKNDLDSWVDWDDIPPTVDWMRQIEKGIEEADTFLFILSPDSVQSKICREEIEYAVKNGKRLIPIMAREIKGDEAPPQLGHLNWIFFRASDDFGAALKKLLTAIQTDYEWAQTHRRLQVKALEWERINKENSFLLRGKDLSDAELQLATNTSKEPHPTDLQRDYVFKSRQAADRQRGIITGISVLGVIVLAALAVFGFMQAGLATANANEAQAASTLAVSNASTAQAASTLAFNNAATAQANEELANERANIARAGEFSLRANTVREEEADLAMLLGIEAYRLKDNISTRATLLDNVLYQPNLQQYLFGHTGEVTSVAFSPDGKIIASASFVEIILWDAMTGKPIGEPFIGYGDNMAFSPDGKTLAAGGENHPIILWDVNTRKPISQPEGHTSTGAYALEFSPDGKLLASDNYVDLHQNIAIWNVQTGKTLEISFTGDGTVNDISFSPDGKTIASADTGGAVILWDTQTGELIGKLFIRESERRTIDSVAFSPDGETLVSSTSEEINIWNLKTHQPIGKILAGASDIAFTPDGKTLVSSNGDITRWDMATYQPVGQPWAVGSSRCIAISSDGKTLVSGNINTTVTVWNLQTHLLLGKSLTGDLENITSINVISLDGKTLATVQQDSKAILLWDIAGQHLVEKLLPGYDIYIMAFSPDGRMLATNGSDGTTIIIWDLKTEKPIGQPLVDKSGISGMVFSPDSKQIVTIGGYFRLWSVETHQVVKDISVKDISVDQFWGYGDTFAGISFAGISFNPDGNLIAFIYSDLFGTRAVAIWDSQKDKITKLPNDFGYVYDIIFSPDGKTLVTAGEQIAFWDTQSWKPVGLTIKGISNSYFHPTLNQDGTELAATTGESIMLWDIRSRQPIGQPIPGYNMTGWGTNLMFNPADNGKSIISINCAQDCAHEAVILWDLDPQSWIVKVCERVGRNFTYNEWKQLFPEMDYKTTCTNWPIHPSVARGITEQIFSNIKISQKAKTAIDKVIELLKGDTTVKDPISESKRLVGIFVKEKLEPDSAAMDVETIKSMIDLVNAANYLGLSIAPSTLNNICWDGSIEGYAQDVLPFCEQAVSPMADNAGRRDSRGLARALTGDFAGAILDFQFYVDTYGEGDMVKQRQQWILDLKAGKNPFTPEVLEALKEQ